MTLSKCTCKTCDGSGKLYLSRSWLIADGYRTTRCWICGGTGKSAAKADADVVKFQRVARERLEVSA